MEIIWNHNFYLSGSFPSLRETRICTSPERIVYVYRGMTQILCLPETEILMGLEGQGKYHRRGVA